MNNQAEQDRFDTVFKAITEALHQDGEYVLLSVREAAAREVLRVVDEQAERR